jgi:hypothetical protein
MDKLLLMSVLGLGIGIGASQAAEVVVRVGPPRAIVEHRAPRPSPRHLWIAGYHRGMAAHTSGSQAAGNFRPANMPCGLRLVGNIGMKATFLSRAAGGSHAQSKPN